MRKTSQDNGDSTSVTSGVENEVRKPILSILKTKKGSLKRNAPNLAEESDDTVIEPLLLKDKERNDQSQSSKYFAKAKADTVKEISKLFNDRKSQYASTSSFGTTETLLSEKDHVTPKSNTSNAPLHNYMNTNVFHSHDKSKSNVTVKSLVEIDGSKQSGYSPSPLIFTTAKIHTNGKSKQMEPVQMTPAPILSTIEVSVSKSDKATNETKISNVTSIMNSIYSHNHNIQENSKDDTAIVLTSNIIPTQTKDTSSMNGNIINVSKPATTISFNDKNISSPPVTSKSMISGPENDKPGMTKDSKLLDNEPRILLSESKLKSTIPENTKPSILVPTAKPLLEQSKHLDLSTKQHQNNLPNTNKSDKSFEKHEVSTEHSKTLHNNIGIGDSQHLPTKNIKFPAGLTQITSKPSTTSNMNANNSILLDLSKESSAKKKSTSAKITDPTNANDSKLSKEIDKLPKLSANDLPKSNPNTATSSNNKISNSYSIDKPASNVSSSNDMLENISNMKEKVLESTPCDSKAISKVSSSSTPSTVEATTITSSELPSIVAKTTSSSKIISNTVAKTTISSGTVFTTAAKTTSSSTAISTTMAKTTLSSSVVSTAAKIPPPSASVSTSIANVTVSSNVTPSVNSKINLTSDAISSMAAKTTLPSNEISGTTAKTTISTTTVKSTLPLTEISSIVPKTTVPSNAVPSSVDKITLSSMVSKTTLPSNTTFSPAKTTLSNTKNAAVTKTPISAIPLSSTPPSKIAVSSMNSKSTLPSNTIPSTVKTSVSSRDVLSPAASATLKSFPITKTSLPSNGIPTTVAKSIHSSAASSAGAKSSIHSSAIPSTASTKTTTVSTKSTSVTSAKASSKPSTVPSIKSPQGSVQPSNTKQPSVSAAKTSASKTSQGNVGGHGSASVVQPTASKTTQVSTRKSTGNNGTTGGSSAAAETQGNVGGHGTASVVQPTASKTTQVSTSKSAGNYSSTGGSSAAAETQGNVGGHGTASVVQPTATKTTQVSTSKSAGNYSSTGGSSAAAETQGNVGGHGTASVVQPTATKTTQVSTSKSAGNYSSTGGSSAAAETAKSSTAKELETKNKGGSKPSDHTKGNQVVKS